MDYDRDPLGGSRRTDGPSAPRPYDHNPAFVPDHVPDDLVNTYGREARQAARYMRSSRYRLGRTVRAAASELHSSTVWMTAVIIFFWMVAGAAVVGAIAYAISLWPWFAAFVLLPLVVLFALALAMASRMVRKQAAAGAGEDPIIQLP